MAPGITKFTCLDRGTQFIQAAAKGLGVAYNLSSILTTELLHFTGGNKQGRQGVQVMVTRGTWENSSISSRPEFFLRLSIHITQNDTTLWTWKGFVRATSHPCCAFMQGRLKLTSRYQPQNMSAVIEQGNVFRFAVGSNLLDRFRKEKEAFTHDDQLGRNRVNYFNRFFGVNVIMISS